MAKISSVKKKANRLDEFVNYAIKHELVSVFGVEPSIGMLAEHLGYSESKFKTIMHGNSHMATVEKLANSIAEICPILNANYVIKGEKNMTKEVKKNELPELNIIDDMDDDLEGATLLQDDDLESAADSDLDNLEEIADDDLEDLTSAEEESAMSTEEVKDTAKSFANAWVAGADKSDGYIPKSGKDKWADAAIELGITDINDNAMSYLDHKMNRMHMFKAKEGDLPYRQEIYDVQAVGMSTPTVINYEDDKVKYSVNLAAVFENTLVVDASSKEEAEAKVRNMLTSSKFVVGGKALNFVDVMTTIKAVK